ncbi:hypothetical protein ABFB09_08800 [Dehalogenimonas sp. THU2]|uniref:phage terminase large subunit family protein n=1 Tax=Dehalogenimonas sp. THU2 TaxID=3151121 RepID=UPI00321828A7
MVELRPYQKEIFSSVVRSVTSGAGLTFTVEIARQGGKNELSAALEIYLAAAYGLGSEVNIVKCAPTFTPQARISLRRLIDRLNERGFRGHYTFEGGHTVRVFGARVVFLSADPEANVVGNTAHLLLEADEAQDIDADKFDRDFRPMAAVGNATTVLYGTPWDGGSLLEETKRRNLELERVDGVKRHFRFDWREVARYNPAYGNFVEGERVRLGDDHPVFRTQYALDSLPDGSGFLNRAQLAQMAGAHRRLGIPEKGKVYVAGLDLAGDNPGSGSDSTVLTVAEIDLATSFIGIAEPCIRVVRQYAWTGEPVTTFMPKVVDLARHWDLKRLVVDATGMGQPLASTLIQQLGSRVKPFIFTAASKSQLAFEFLAAVNTGRVKLHTRDASPESAECWRQLEGARAQYRPNRTINFHVGSAKSHDDYLTSLVLTYEAASLYQPRVARGYKR